MGDTNILMKLLALIDSLVELYLLTLIKPFLCLHEKFYNALNNKLREFFEQNKSKIPDWFSANLITYARTVLVIPVLLLLSASDHVFIPSFIVILVDFGDFLDGVVARFWFDVKKETEEVLSNKEKGNSPQTSDDDSYGMYFCREEKRYISSE